MIEPEDIKPFKTFVRAICFHSTLCTRFITGCRGCLQRNGMTIIDDQVAEEFTGIKTHQEMLMSVHC